MILQPVCLEGACSVQINCNVIGGKKRKREKKYLDSDNEISMLLLGFYEIAPDDEECSHASFFRTGHDNKGQFSIIAQTGHGNKGSSSVTIIDMASFYLLVISVEKQN